MEEKSQKFNTIENKADCNCVANIEQFRTLSQRKGYSSLSNEGQRLEQVNLLQYRLQHQEEFIDKFNKKQSEEYTLRAKTVRAVATSLLGGSPQNSELGLNDISKSSPKIDKSPIRFKQTCSKARNNKNKQLLFELKQIDTSIPNKLIDQNLHQFSHRILKKASDEVLNLRKNVRMDPYVSKSVQKLDKIVKYHEDQNKFNMMPKTVIREYKDLKKNQVFKYNKVSIEDHILKKFVRSKSKRYFHDVNQGYVREELPTKRMKESPFQVQSLYSKREMKKPEIMKPKVNKNNKVKHNIVVKKQEKPQKIENQFITISSYRSSYKKLTPKYPSPQKIIQVKPFKNPSPKNVIVKPLNLNKVLNRDLEFSTARLPSMQEQRNESSSRLSKIGRFSCFTKRSSSNDNYLQVNKLVGKNQYHFATRFMQKRNTVLQPQSRNLEYENSNQKVTTQQDYSENDSYCQINSKYLNNSKRDSGSILQTPPYQKVLAPKEYILFQNKALQDSSTDFGSRQSVINVLMSKNEETQDESIIKAPKFLIKVRQSAYMASREKLTRPVSSQRPKSLKNYFSKYAVPNLNKNVKGSKIMQK